MVLYLDTTDNEQARIVVLSSEHKVSEYSMALGNAESFPLAVNDYLTKQKLTWSNIHLIAVRVGAGYHSHIRTGVVLANALAYALDVPVVGVEGEPDYKKIILQKGSRAIVPVYSGKPNISKPKARVRR
jgi:tRNA A37 threonylcarbamoyladenosine modification protein TsaB